MKRVLDLSIRVGCASLLAGAPESRSSCFTNRDLACCCSALLRRLACVPRMFGESASIVMWLFPSLSIWAASDRAKAPRGWGLNVRSGRGDIVVGRCAVKMPHGFGRCKGCEDQMTSIDS